MALRLATAVVEPYFYECALLDLSSRKDCPYPGIVAQLLERTFSLGEIPYELIKGRDLPPLTVGPFTGKYAHILKGDVDTSSSRMVFTPARAKWFAFSFPSGEFKPVFVVAERTQDLLSTMLVPFDVYRPAIWVCLAVLFGLLILALVAYRYKFGDVAEQGLGRTLWELVRYGLLQGNREFRETSLAANGVLTMLGFLIVIVTNLYQGGLLAQLLAPPAEQSPFKDSETMMKLVEKGQLTITVPTYNNWYLTELNNSNEDYFIKLRSVVKNNPIHVAGSRRKVLELVRTGRYIYPTDDLSARFIGQKDCQFRTVSGHNLPSLWVGFLLANNSVWLRQFSEALAKTQDYAEVLTHRYLNFEGQKCPKIQKRTIKSLSVLKLSGVFAVAVIGWISSFSAFIMEKLSVGGKQRGWKKPHATLRSSSKRITQKQAKECLTLLVDYASRGHANDTEFQRHLRQLARVYNATRSKPVGLSYF